MEPVARAAALRRWWPGRLGHQILLVLALVTLATMGLLYLVSTHRLDDASEESARQHARDIAETAAGLGAVPLTLNDREGLVRALQPLAALPMVQRIDVLDHDGQPWLAVVRSAQGTVGVAPGRAPAAPAPRLSPRLPITVEAWAGAGGGALGRIGVTYSLAESHMLLERLRFDAVAALALASLITLGTAGLLLGRALAPLRRLAAFSRSLEKTTGETLALQPRSRELADLGDALNHASGALHAQLQEIRAARERSVAVLDAVPDAVIGLDAQGRVGFASPAAASVFGLNPERVAGLRIETLLPEVDAKAAEERSLSGVYMRASKAHLARFETIARRHDGTEFPADVSLSRIETPGGTRYTCVVRDITEQRMSFSMLNLYSRALECTSNGVVISDMSLPGSPVFYANAAFGRITGYEPGDAIGRNCAFLQRGDTDQPAIGQLREAIARGQSCQTVVRNYRQDGTLFFNELSISPVPEPDGSVRHYVGVLNDVTERERARLAIAERSARLNAVFELSPDGFVVFDKEQRLVYSNAAFQAMTGWSGDAEAGAITLAEFDRRFARLCDATHPPRGVAEAIAADADEAETLTVARPQPRVLARVVRRQLDGLGETILFFRDVTHETEVDRMKSEFLTTAAHELRTPMVSVYGFTELLLNRQVSDVRRRDMLETIHRQASLLINMVNELLDLARIEARRGKDLRRETCRLGELLGQAVGTFATPGAPHRMLVRAGSDDALLFVDPEKTHRALTNVLSNAVKYSPQGGEIVVDTLDGELDGQPAVGVRVRDHGIGMTPEQLARVFERFYRADPSGNIPGTGLGMSLVKEIAELQGGRVQIDSHPGLGTEVVLWLPRVPEAVRLSDD